MSHVVSRLIICITLEMHDDLCLSHGNGNIHSHSLQYCLKIAPSLAFTVPFVDICLKSPGANVTWRY